MVLLEGQASKHTGCRHMSVTDTETEQYAAIMNKTIAEAAQAEAVVSRLQIELAALKRQHADLQKLKDWCRRAYIHGSPEIETG